MSASASVSTRLPWLPGALGYAEAWVFAGGAHNNHAFYNPLVTYTRPVLDWQETLLHDPQTSGGLLVAVPPDRLDVFLRLLRRARSVCVGHRGCGGGCGD